MTDLSPAAQAVRHAAYHLCPSDQAHRLEARIAAALRAAADQVVPTEIATSSKWPERHDVRHQLFAIASELDPS